MRLTRHAFHTWLGVRHDVPSTGKPCVIRARGVNYVCYMPLAGSYGMRWIRQGQEDRCTVVAGQVCVFPADGHEHVLVLDGASDYQAFALLLPDTHVRIAGTSYSVGDYGLSQKLTIDPGAALSDSMLRLSGTLDAAEHRLPDAIDDLARSLLEQLHAAFGAAAPHWEDHDNAFDPLTTRTIVGSIDGHLKEGIRLDDVAVLVGLSGSHFARKFQQTVGMSLQRFVHRRRIRRSLALLRDPSLSIPDVAAELGYTTRSHFMRMFRGITGMTPARYRRNGVSRHR